MLIEPIQRQWLMSASRGRAGGFNPGLGQPGVKNPISFQDASDKLVNAVNNNDSLPIAASGPGILLLADGSRFEGELFGSEGIAQGELVFTTGMAGYQESLTDPSFAGQVLTFTYPLIGNYGIHASSSESSSVWPRALICRELIVHPDHRNSIGNVDEFLRTHGVPGLKKVDTRAITKKVREYGTLLCVMGPLEKEEELKELLEEIEDPSIDDLIETVCISKPVIVNEGALDENGNKLPRLGVLDCGIKYNIINELSKRFEVLWCPPDIKFEDLINKWNISALFCSNGPGDPAQEGRATLARKTLAKGIKSGIPTMGICLGHQLLGLAAGLETYKMLYGHRGANQPVIDIKTGKVSITSQNHGFAVADPEKGRLAEHPSKVNSGRKENLIDSKVKVSHINANDNTVEGLEVIGKPAFSVQYHPEACPGPNDASKLFDQFENIVRGELNAKKK